MCLAKNICDDGTGVDIEAWCGQADHCDIADIGSIAKVDCQNCFEAVRMYWYSVRDQWQEVGPW